MPVGLSVDKVSKITLFSLKVLRFFYLKYKTKLDPGHVPTSETEIFVTKAVVAKGFILDVARDPRYTSDGCCNSNPMEQKIIIKVNKIYF